MYRCTVKIKFWGGSQLGSQVRPVGPTNVSDLSVAEM